MGSKGGGAQTVDEITLPDWSADVATEYLKRAGEIALKPYATYSGWYYDYETYANNDDQTGGLTYAPQNANEVDGISALATRGRDGSALVTKGRAFILDQQWSLPQLWFYGANAEITLPVTGDNAYLLVTGLTSGAVARVQNVVIQTPDKTTGYLTLIIAPGYTSIGTFTPVEDIRVQTMTLDSSQRPPRVRSYHAFALYYSTDSNFNPQMDAVYTSKMARILKDFTEKEIPNINQDALIAGYYGGSGHKLLLANAVYDYGEKMESVFSDTQYKTYVAGRQRQHEVLQHSVHYGEESERNIKLLRQAGLYRREFLQGSYADQYKATLDAQEMKISRINVLGNAVKTLVGAQVSKTTPYYRPNAFTQMAGIAAAGIGMYDLYKKDPNVPDKNIASKNTDTAFLGPVNVQPNYDTSYLLSWMPQQGGKT